MRSENKKIAIVITLTVIALLVNIPLLAILLGADVRGWPFNHLSVHFTRWGWFLVFVLAGFAFKETFKLKLIRKSSKQIIQVVLILMLGFAVIWLLLAGLGYALSTIH
jgi:Kef-type K+ transport system membrane component KefB